MLKTALAAALAVFLPVFAAAETGVAQTDAPQTDAPQTGADIALQTNRAMQNVTEGAFQPGLLDFTVEVQGLSVRLERFFALALPGEVVEFAVEARPDSPAFNFETGEIERTLEGPQSLAIKAPPTPGAYEIAITSQGGESMRLTLFVMVPATEVENGRLGGYRIGDYPARPLRGLDSYLPPEGFIKMPPELYDHKLSPHFTLGQFVSKQGGSEAVKYLLVRPELVKKLETLLRKVNAEGIRADSFYVMSGYRTPFYNEAIGNVLYSRHQWGDAADIYIDRAPQDENMDDIDGDGRVLRKDAGRLYDIAEEVDNLNELRAIRGGVGEYGANAAHGPFVHVDTRGTPARWGR